MSTDQTDFGFDNEITAQQIEAKAERDRVREVYSARLAEKLKDPEFRKIEGFPIGTDEAILALSDPPYYTACPNPFIEEWLAENGKPYDAVTDTYHREPFAADVSEGKNDPIYNAHSYHTKVPHKAIMRYILHYTEPGDVVYDGFCGTGMTGVAAQMCGNKAQVESLGYRVQDDDIILDETGKPISKLGARKAILNDLSPAATFIAYNYNAPVEAMAFEREAKQILADAETEYGWMYSTLYDALPDEIKRVASAVQSCKTIEDLCNLHRDLKSGKSQLQQGNRKLSVARINYVVWSDVLVCPVCGAEVIYWDSAVSVSDSTVKGTLACSQCRSESSKADYTRALSSKYDKSLGIIVQQTKQVPATINYTAGLTASGKPKRQPNKLPDEYDKAIVEATERFAQPRWFPTNSMMGKGAMFGDLWRAGYHIGLTHTHHFYKDRSLLAIAEIYSRSQQSAYCQPILFLLTSFIVKTGSILHNIGFKNGSINLAGAMPLVLYVPSCIAERDIFGIAAGKLNDLRPVFGSWKIAGSTLVRTGSASNPLADCSLDYIFTDPPFGGNIMYSELNFLWESWLRVTTNNKLEAITNTSQKKGLEEYRHLMELCLASYYRALKPGRWMTVEFHNSANSVWNALQEAMQKAGFVLADVRILDKKQGTFKQMTTNGAVDKDLVLSCYKPHSEFENRFVKAQGTQESALEFVRQHLSMLPVAPLTLGGKLEPVAERNRFLLFDRMIAYHLQRGAPIPIDAAPFYKMLEEQFTCRDEMYFLPEQAAQFDALKARGMEIEQLSIFVQDEKTAVQWVRGALSETPQTLGDLTPAFMQELRDWPAHEPRPELKDLLREYFIQEDGVWRVPDPDSEKDIEQLRKNALLRLFRDYTKVKGPLKIFRKEAIIQGFTTCYETNQYGVIVSVCEKIPEKIRNEIQEFVMFYDIAKSLAPSEIVQTEFVFE